MDQRDEGKVITLTWCFSAFSIFAHCGENHPTLKHSVCKNPKAKANLWLGMCVIFCIIWTKHCIHIAQCRQTTLITLPRPYTPSVPNHKRIKRVGEQGPLAWCKNTSFKKTLVYSKTSLVFLYMLLLLSFGFYKLEWKTACVKKQGFKTVGCVSSLGSWPVDGNRLS